MREGDLSVGFVAKRCGVNVSSLHFYEQKGLIKSLRNQGNQRRYKPDVLRRISIIKAAQKVGVSLEEIKRSFAKLPNSRTPNKKDWAALSSEWQKSLDAKITYMQRLRDLFDGCIGCGCLSMEKCPIYNPDDSLAVQGPGPVILDKLSK